MRGSSLIWLPRRGALLAGALSLMNAPAPAAAQRRAASTGSIAGLVRDEAGAPIASVEVVAIKHAIAARTDSLGKFFLAALPAGALDLTFRRLAFEPAVVTIDLPADDTTEIQVKLTVSAQRLTGVLVNDRAPKRRVLQGFETRRSEGIGYFVTRAQIEKRHPVLLSDMLRMIPGTILTAGETGRMTLRFSRSGARNCPPQYYVDGIMATGYSIDDMAPGDVEGVELFAGAAGLPPEFNRMRSTSNCGSVLIWTKIPGVQ